MKRFFLSVTILSLAISFKAECQSTLLNGLIDYYNLDETSGLTMDALNNNNATAVSATQGVTNAIKGTCYTFSGNSDKITFANANWAISATGSFSISMWVYLTADQPEQWTTLWGNEAGPQFSLMSHGSDNYSEDWWTSGTATEARSTSTVLWIDHWHHIVMVKNSSTISFYRDGNLVTTVTGNNEQDVPAKEIYLGGDNYSGGAQEFVGNMDEVGIWNRALTAAEVTTLYNNGYGLTYPFTIVPVTGVTVSPTNASVGVGSTTSLTTTLSPSDATDPGITWSTSNASIATVDNSGVVTGVALGTATITATTNDGGYTSSSNITVDVPVTGVTVSPTSASVGVGATTSLSAGVSPSNATDPSVSWSTSDASIATVSTSGVVTGVAVGTATITATTTDGNYTASSDITVNIPVTSVTVLPASASVAVGSTTSLSATVSPSNATDPSVSWSTSDASIATVSTSGVVTGVATGTATITATTTDGSYTASSTISVQPASPDGTPYGGSDWPIPGQIEAENYNDGGEGVAYHDDDANNHGNVYRPSEGVDIESGDGGYVIGWFNAGEWMNYTVDVTSGTYDIIICTATGSSGMQLGVYLGGNLITTIDVIDNGTYNSYVETTVKGISLSGGNGQILKLENVNGNFNLDWIKFVQSGTSVYVTGVSVSPATASVNVGSTTSLTATLSPTNPTDPSVSWSSSDASIATVDNNGVVTGVSEGTATIKVTAKDGGYTASSDVTVNVPVTGVSVSPTSASVGVGATTSLAATVAPSNATDQGVSWSTSDASIATVSSSGVVTGVALGTATITVTTTDGSYTASSDITVDVPVTGVSVSPATTSINAGLSTPLTATVTPSNATDQDVSWSTSDPSIATVNSSGVVTGVAAGTATITVTTTDGSYTASSDITVNPENTIISVTSVTVSPTNATVAVGSTTSLNATVDPSNATDPSVSWGTSDASIATVSSSGVVTGVAAGTATVTVTTTDGSFTASSNITVGIPVSTVSVSPTGASVEVGATTTLTKTITPADATQQGVTWSSDNTAVATVDASGVVTGVAPGTAVITMTSDDNSSLTATSTIMVYAAGSSPWQNITGGITYYNKIGIGTSQLNHQLEVNGDANVSGELNAQDIVTGTIQADQIQVSLSALPDFVFDKKYNLKSLSEVEAYINKNGHLPGIPSAEKVDSCGMNVGQMNALLLMKIEEMTLYMIKQNKALLKQGDQLKQQAAKIQMLEQEINDKEHGTKVK